jgi:hypothetical protein
LAPAGHGAAALSSKARAGDESPFAVRRLRGDAGDLFRLAAHPGDRLGVRLRLDGAGAGLPLAPRAPIDVLGAQSRRRGQPFKSGFVARGIRRAAIVAAKSADAPRSTHNGTRIA